MSTMPGHPHPAGANPPHAAPGTTGAVGCGWNLVALSAAEPQPWRNGGGVTRELLAFPGATDWRVRISVADVTAPGPFSRFAGIERWFAVLEGDGVVLRVDGVPHPVGPSGPALRFSGEAGTDCELRGGPTLDFNLMAAPGCGRLDRLDGPRVFTAPAGALIGLYAHAAGGRIVVDGTSTEVPAGHLAWQLAEAPLRGEAHGAGALFLEVSP